MAIEVTRFYGEVSSAADHEMFSIKNDRLLIMGSEEIAADMLLIDSGDQTSIYNAPDRLIIQSPSHDNPAVELIYKDQEDSIEVPDILPGQDLAIKFLGNKEHGQPRNVVGALVLSKTQTAFEFAEAA